MHVESGENVKVQIAIVVVSFNTCKHLRRCLESIDATALAATGLAIHTIVVDNGSRDGSPQMVAAEFEQVELLEPNANLGFTGGNNLALRRLGFQNVPVSRPVWDAEQQLPSPGERARPDYVLLLNPDAELTTGALETLVEFMTHSPQVGVCGPRLSYGDGAFQHAAFAFPDWRQVLLDASPIPLLPGLRRVWTRLLHSGVNGRYAPQLWQGQRPFAVDFVLGAAMLARGDAIESVGGLDDGFFMYCEEMDWCLRMAEGGWGVFAVPGAHIIHYEAQSSRQVRRPAYVRLWRSRLRFFRKHARRYGTLHLAVIHLLARLHWRMGYVRAWRNFAGGVISGRELQAEIDTYRQLRTL